MLNIDSLKNGVVIDHIKAGKSVDIINYLKLDDCDCSVAVIKNAKSNKMGKKDIIKIEDYKDINLDFLGFIDPNITISIIKNDELVEKKALHLPKEIKNIIKCKNPRCITSIEQEIEHIFCIDNDNSYRCIYCEHKHK